VGTTSSLVTEHFVHFTLEEGKQRVTSSACRESHSLVSSQKLLNALRGYWSGLRRKLTEWLFPGDQVAHGQPPHHNQGSLGYLCATCMRFFTLRRELAPLALQNKKVIFNLLWFFQNSICRRNRLK
jgi:hypothetical protein